MVRSMSVLTSFRESLTTNRIGCPIFILRQLYAAKGSQAMCAPRPRHSRASACLVRPRHTRSASAPAACGPRKIIFRRIIFQKSTSKPLKKIIPAFSGIKLFFWNQSFFWKSASRPFEKNEKLFSGHTVMGVSGRYGDPRVGYWE